MFYLGLAGLSSFMYGRIEENLKQVQESVFGASGGCGFRCWLEVGSAVTGSCVESFHCGGDVGGT